MKINIYLDDSLKAMESMPDKKYGLAIVDPVYGHDKIRGGYTSGKGGGMAKQKQYNQSIWTETKTDKIYFDELFRSCENQIIWGANYFTNHLPPSMGWIFWDKQNGEVSFSDGEFAFTSFQSKARQYKYLWSGMLKKYPEERIHPTQKPVALYKWLLKNYGFNKDGSKRTIFDSHGGSMSIVIACIDMGFDIDIWEIDPDYYRDGVNRVKRHLAQLDLTRELVQINYYEP